MQARSRDALDDAAGAAIGLANDALVGGVAEGECGADTLDDALVGDGSSVGGDGREGEGLGREHVAVVADAQGVVLRGGGIAKEDVSR